MKDEQPHRGPLPQLRELQHGDVAVRVPSSEDGAPAGAAPDADRLLRAVVEVFRCPVWVIVPLFPSLVYASMELLPITRSLGVPHISSLIGRMKSRPPPEAM